MSKIEHDRPDWHRGNTFRTLGEASAGIVAAVRIATVGETTGQCDQAADSPIVFDAKVVRRLEHELAQARLKTAQALADVAAARNALELTIALQDAQHKEAMARMKVRHDAKVAQLDDMITTLVGKLTQSRKDPGAVRPVAATLDAVEWGWHAPAGLLPRGMR